MTTFQQIAVIFVFIAAHSAFNNAFRRLKGLERELEKLQERLWQLENGSRPRLGD